MRDFRLFKESIGLRRVRILSFDVESACSVPVEPHIKIKFPSAELDMQFERGLWKYLRTHEEKLNFNAAFGRERSRKKLRP
jgi:hypothetical protein